MLGSLMLISANVLSDDPISRPAHAACLSASSCGRTLHDMRANLLKLARIKATLAWMGLG
jgi:hypothetical protein